MEKKADDHYNENNQLIFSTRGPLSSVDMVFCFLNSAIGIGALQFGPVFACGYGFAVIILFVFAVVSYISMYLFLSSASIFRQSTFEEIWIAAFGPNTVFIPATASIISSLSNAVHYTSFAQKFLIVIISQIFNLISKDLSDLFTKIDSHSFIVGLAIIIIYYLPMSFSVHMKFIVRASYICCFMCAVFALYITARFGLIVKKDGFDPSNQFKWFNLTEVPASVGSTMFAFLIYPLTYPGLRHAKVPTYKNIRKMFIITAISLFSIYLVIGTFDYLTFFGKDTTGMILDFYPVETKSDKVLILFGSLIALIFVSSTTPMCINGIRYILLTTIQQKSSFPKDIWIFIGIAFSLISLFLANMTENSKNIIAFIQEIMASILQCIFPSLLYLRGNKFKNKLNSALAIFLLIFGVALLAFVCYHRHDTYK